MRALGIDLGTRRIGVALSDSAGTVATPYEVVERSGDEPRDHRRIAELAHEVGAEAIVVGLPRSLSGAEGTAATEARREADAIARAAGLPVATWDERLTTVTAHRDLAAAGVRSRDRRTVVDKVAAAVMLQSWLDRQHAAPATAAGGPPTPGPAGPAPHPGDDPR